jgi:Mrp family chromosome partitioning ATPase
MRELLEFARCKYDQVWIDTPPTQMFADALVLAKQVDGFIIVAEWSKTSKKQLKDTHDLIMRSGGNILGIIVNKVKVDNTISEYMMSYNNYYRKSDQRGFFRYLGSLRPISEKLKVKS